MSSSRAIRLGVGHRHAPILAVMLALVFSGVGAGGPVLTRAGADQTVVTQADATVRKGMPNMNFGAASQLVAKRYRARFFLRFDLTPWYGLPIESMRLRVKVDFGNVANLRFRQAGTSWSESAITWNNQPSVSWTPVVTPTSVATGTFDIDMRPLFQNGTVDRQMLAIQATATTTLGAGVAARESGVAPRLVFSSAESSQPGALDAEDILRFYTPNIIARGDSSAWPRDTTADQMSALFSDDQSMAMLLANVDVYCFFGSSVGRGDPAYDQMLARAVPMLADHGVAIGLEVGGPLGYAAPGVYGGDVNGENGRKSALIDLGRRIAKVEAAGGEVRYLLMDGALRRTIRNGMHKSPHAAFGVIGSVAARTSLSYRAKFPGSSGNSISVAYSGQSPSSPLSVTAIGNSITVLLATDSLGNATSTAGEVASAVNASSAASALVSVANYATSDGSGRALLAPSQRLAYGDDGLNRTPEESAEEVVSYMRTIHQARPNIRLILIEDVVLWPYEGRAGYSGAAYPSGQRPDFKIVWDELIDQLRDAGLKSLLVGMHNDAPVEYLDRLVPSSNRNADDWYGRIFKQQAQVESDGIAFAQHFNSLWGGNPEVSSLASASYFQSQVLHQVVALQEYRAEHQIDQRMTHFAIDAFMYFPREVAPSTNPYSTDATYLKALQRYQALLEQGRSTESLVLRAA